MSTEISPLTPLAVTSLRPVKLEDLKQIDPSMLRRVAVASFEPKTPPLPQGPPDEDYARVKVGGRVVATLTNNGAAITPNAGPNLQDIFENDMGLTGPALAQSRADRIAQRLGGEVVKADTALTQSQWRAQQSVASTAQIYVESPPALAQRNLMSPALSALLALQGG